MQINFLGTGGAFDFQLGNSAAVLDFKGHRILIDCGNTTYRQLREARIADTIDHILITHCHDDHVGSLTTLILHNKYYLKSPQKTDILVPSEAFKNYLCDFLKFAIPNYNEVVSFSPLSSIPGIEAVDTFGKHVENMPSFGYIFEDDDHIYGYSGDVSDPNIIFDALKVKLATGKEIKVFHDMSFDERDVVHCYYKDLIPHLEHFQIFAYHLDPRDNPADNPIALLADHPHYLVSNNPNLHIKSK